MKRGAISTILAVGLAAWTTNAAAQEATSVADPTAAHAAQVGVGAGWMWLGSSNRGQPFEPASILQIAASYGLSRAVSIGAVGSHGDTESGLHVWRFSGEGRYHAVRTRAFDLWGAGEAGFFATKFEPKLSTCGVCDLPAAAPPTRIAPLLGTGVGFDLLPLPYVSLGLEARALVGAFGNASDGGPSGLSQSFSVGATLALRLPLGG